MPAKNIMPPVVDQKIVSLKSWGVLGIVFWFFFFSLYPLTARCLSSDLPSLPILSRTDPILSYNGCYVDLFLLWPPLSSPCCSGPPYWRPGGSTCPHFVSQRVQPSSTWARRPSQKWIYENTENFQQLCQSDHSDSIKESNTLGFNFFLVISILRAPKGIIMHLLLLSEPTPISRPYLFEND